MIWMYQKPTDRRCLKCRGLHAMCFSDTLQSRQNDFVIKTTNIVFPANNHVSNMCNEIQFASLFVYFCFPKHIHINADLFLCETRRRVVRGTVETDWFKDLAMIVCFLLGNYPASEVYMPTFRNTLSVPSSQAFFYPPMNMEQTECSETLAYKLQTPGNYPKESIQHTEHGESLKSRI